MGINKCNMEKSSANILFRLLYVVPSGVRFIADRLLCFLIVGIHSSGILIPLSLKTVPYNLLSREDVS